jgi:hypothetical protein
MGEAQARRAGAAGAALLAVLGVVGCGAPDQGADGRPYALQASEAGLTGKDAAAAVAARDAAAVAAAPKTVRDCVARNPAPTRPDGAWRASGLHAAHLAVIEAIYGHLQLDADGGKLDRRLRKGFLGYGLDAGAKPRLIVLVDPARVDVPELRREVRRVAAKANKGVSGPGLTVSIQEGCFGARAVERVFAALLKGAGSGSVELTVQLDGRVHSRFCDRELGWELQRKFGPVLAVDHGCVATADS